MTYIIIYEATSYYELNNDVEVNQMYCVTYSDEPSLKNAYGKYLAVHWDDNAEFTNYLG